MKRKKSQPWHKLDNAAKIFPSNSDKRDTKVFRFSCELLETIEENTLQLALEQTLKKFPYYCSILKRGLFWYYLENTERKPLVHIENRHPCATLYYPNRKTLLFDVSYYGKRINVEVHHMLSDGSGALLFLKTLVFYYLLQKYASVLPKDISLEDGTTAFEKSADSFLKYFKKEKKQKSQKIPSAHHLKGEKLDIGQMGVIEARISVKALLSLTKAQGVTVTEFLTALWMYAIYEGMSLREQKKPVVISIPVNLRSYFPSETTRNFFQVVSISYFFGKQQDSFETVLSAVKKSFREKLTLEGLRSNMNALSALEHNLPMKLVPLVTKDPILKLANWLSDRKVTSTLSNIGKIEMPKELLPYIHFFDVFVSTKTTKMTTCSFQDQFMISITTAFAQQDLPKRFFRHLSTMGLELELTTNLEQEE